MLMRGKHVASKRHTQWLRICHIQSIANALANDSGDYVTPTAEEIEADIQTQRANLCDADGWPDDAEIKQTFKRACSGNLRSLT